jgi:hypothetical protein
LDPIIPRTTGGLGVPQIWLTYDEMAVLIDCEPLAARSAVVSLGLDRRRCRDGLTRTKLSPSLTEAFLDLVVRRRLEQEISASAGDLRAMRDRMAARSLPVPKLRSAAAG